MKKTLITSLLLLIYDLSFAQKIEGIFTDSNKKPIPFVNVFLKSLPDSSIFKNTETDENGFWQIENIKNGRFFIEASMIGFKKYRSPFFNINQESKSLNLGNVQLIQDINELKEVTVVAQKPLVEIKDNMLVLNVASSTLADGNTTLEILSRSPGVSVDNDGNIFLKGKAAVRVLIDGKPSYLSGGDLANYLRNMPSNQVENIEIMSNPPAKYDAEGNAGVINIRTKKNQNYGTNGSINLSAGQGKLPKHNAGITLNNRNQKLNSWLNYAFNYREDLVNSKISRAFQNQLFLQDLRAEYPNLIHNFRGGVDYEISKKNTIGIVVGANSINYKTLARNSSDFINKSNLRDATTLTKTNNEVLNQNLSVAFNYRHLFKKAGQELNFDADYSIFKFKDDQNYDSEFKFFNSNREPIQDLLLGKIRSDIRVRAFKTDFVNPISKTLSMELGLKTSFVDTKNDVIFWNNQQVDKGKTNNFSYEENINAGYLNFTKTYSKIRINAGLRLENTVAEGFQVANDSSFNRNYWNLFPNISLKHSLPKKHEIAYSFSRRIDRPNYQDLNPFLFFFDNYTFVIGNSFLNPQLTSLFEVNYSHPKNIILTANYSKTNGVMTRVQEQIDATNTIFQTVLNLNTFENFGLTLNFPLKFNKNWTSNNSINAFRNRYYGVYLNQSFDNAQNSLNINSIQNFTFKNGFLGELNLNYQSGFAYGINRFVETGSVSAGLQKSVFERKGTIRLNVRDIFYTQIRGANIIYQNMNIRVRHRIDSRFATLSLNYRFGNTKVAPARQRRSASEEERRRTGQ